MMKKKCCCKVEKSITIIVKKNNMHDFTLKLSTGMRLCGLMVGVDECVFFLLTKKFSSR